MKDAVTKLYDLNPKVIGELASQKVTVDELAFDQNFMIEVADEINEAVTSMYLDSKLPTAKHIAKVTLAITKNVQLRDYLMGLHTEIEGGVTAVGQYLEVLAYTVPNNYNVPARTVLAQYLYIKEQYDEAKNLIKKILEESDGEPYTLATLLRRVFTAEWPGQSISDMAGQLHPKVKKVIYG